MKITKAVWLFLPFSIIYHYETLCVSLTPHKRSHFPTFIPKSCVYMHISKQIRSLPSKSI